MSSTIGMIGLGLMGHGIAKKVRACNLGLGERYVASLFEAQEQLNGVRIVPR